LIDEDMDAEDLDAFFADFARASENEDWARYCDMFLERFLNLDPVQLRSTFVLRYEDRWRIALYLNHGSLLEFLGLATPA
jgi:ketosteroid isomerase-like protein